LSNTQNNVPLLNSLAMIIGRTKAERIAMSAAADAAKTESAIRLLEWVADGRSDAKEAAVVFESLFRLVNRELSSALDIGAPAAAWVREAQRFESYFSGLPEARALSQLLDIAKYYDQGNAQLDKLQWLLPTTDRATLSSGPPRDAETMARAFKQLNISVVNVFPRLVLKVMQDYLVMLRECKARGDQAGAAMIKDRAAGLIHMCGFMKREGYSLRTDVAQVLLQMESEVV